MLTSVNIFFFEFWCKRIITGWNLTQYFDSIKLKSTNSTNWLLTSFILLCNPNQSLLLSREVSDSLNDKMTIYPASFYLFDKSLSVLWNFQFHILKIISSMDFMIANWIWSSSLNIHLHIKIIGDYLYSLSDYSIVPLPPLVLLAMICTLDHD